MTSKHTDIHVYLSEASSQNRQDILKSMQRERLAIDYTVVQDLLELDLPVNEKVALIGLASSSDLLALETFLVDNIAMMRQDTAVAALQVWVDRTEHHLWHRIAALAILPHTPQRLLYRIIEAAHFLGNDFVLRHVDRLPNLRDLSPAFHGLLLIRATTCGYVSGTLHELATQMILQFDILNDRALEKALPGAMCYLARFDPQSLQGEDIQDALIQPWVSMVSAVCRIEEEKKAYIKAFEKDLQGTKVFAEQRRAIEKRLPLWLRKDLSAKTLGIVLQQVPATISDRDLLQIFGGVSVDELLSLAETDLSTRSFGVLARILSFLADGKQHLTFLDSCVDRLKHETDVMAFMSVLPATIRMAILSSDKSQHVPTWYGLIQAEQAAAKDAAIHRTDFSQPLFRYESGTAKTAQALFFDVAYRGAKGAPSETDNPYFQKLLAAWQKSDESMLDELATFARKAPAIYKLPYIATLGRFRNSDKAVLKLLDFIRSNEEIELSAVVKALRGVGNGRAALEMISALTRPNVSQTLQLEIVNALKDFDLRNLQVELRSALADLPPSIDLNSAYLEIRDGLSSLLLAATSNNATVDTPAENNEDLDGWLSVKISRFNELSSEVRRALRTARFFQVKVQAAKSSTVIDLSPAIDMQYKALELGFREMFEEACTVAIEAGAIQRKLDVIGYARPIEQQMSQFESYVNALPIVNTIPFFSKFKLRKMLRAICQFRPGKRFTLDGVKAFGLFFLCFGRKEDRYGLANLFPTPFSNDQELFKFCKQLHMFQDTRNRAAHEGFQPDVSKDFDAIWQQTADIFAAAFAIADFLKQNGGMASRGRSQVEQIDQYKKAAKPSHQVQIVHKRSAS